MAFGQEPQCGPNRETFVGQKDYVRGPLQLGVYFLSVSQQDRAGG